MQDIPHPASRILHPASRILHPASPSINTHSMRFFYLFLLACIPCLQAFAQFSFSDSSVRERIRHDIYVLASDSLEGREAGMPGEKKACTYLISRLKEAGIPPWQGGGYLQPFTHGYMKFGKTPHLRISGKSFNWRYDFGLCTYSAGDSLTSLCVDAGFGLVIPGAGIDDYKDIMDPGGKIVLINLGAPAKLSGDKSLRNDLSPAFRLAIAVKKGAAGIIFYNKPGLYGKSLFDFSLNDTLGIPVIYVTQEVADFIREHRSEPVTMAVYINRSTQTYHNITAYIDNRAPRTIILGAHYDHVGKSTDRKYNGAYCVGADDNASGTAGILELARYYSAHMDKKNNYLVIFFSAEEKGLYGSEFFVRDMRPSFRDSVNFMVNFDMIGRLGCEGLQVTAEAAGSSPLWKKLYREVKHPGFHLKKIAPSLPFSDQESFYRKGIPVLYLTTGLHQDYHTPFDKPGTINYTGMAGILNYSEKLVSAAGSGDKVPYRKVPGISLILEMTGFIFDYIGGMMSF